MFSNRIRHVLGYVLSALLFVSTAGVPIHKVICLCKGEQVVTLYVENEQECCQHEERSSPSTCCSSASSPCSQKNEFPAGTCQDTETSLVRIAGQFLTSLNLEEVQLAAPMVPACMWTFHENGQYGNRVHSIQPPLSPFHLSSVPLFRKACQIRC